MATTRNVFGNIKSFTNADIIRATIRFDFTGSFNGASSYVRDERYVKTDDFGDFDVDLIVTDELNQESSYTCYLPTGESFIFKLDTGAAIDLVTLRALALTGVFDFDGALIIDGNGNDIILDGNG